MKSYPHIL